MERFREENNEYLRWMPDFYKELLLKYTQNMFTTVNEYLENGSSPNDEYLDRSIVFLDDILKSAPKLKNDITVYRGIKLPQIPKLHNPLHNYKGLYKGFISTSLDITQARIFVSSNLCVFEIVVPKGTHALYLATISKFREEKELLLPRNGIIEITGFNIQHNTTIVKAKYKQYK